MNNQEMQFADPEWHPSQQEGSSAGTGEAPYVPRPINTDPREQPHWQNVPSQQQEEVSREQQPFYPESPSQKIGPQVGQRPRRRGNPWLWIIALIVILTLIGGGSRSFYGSQRTINLQPYTASVTGLPTIVITDNIGAIHVHTGSTNSVSIVPTERTNGFGFGNPSPDASITYAQSGNTITANIRDNGFNVFGSNGVDVEVTVPTNADLQIKTDTGTIDVSGVNGQMSLTSDNGAITATNDSLSGQSTLQTDTGAVRFDGTIDPNGTYRFAADTGEVNVTLPANASFHLDASTNTGAINSDFPGVNVQHPDVTSATATGDVGNAPRASLTLKTDTGVINLHQA